MVTVISLRSLITAAVYRGSVALGLTAAIYPYVCGLWAQIAVTASNLFWDHLLFLLFLGALFSPAFTRPQSSAWGYTRAESFLFGSPLLCVSLSYLINPLTCLDFTSVDPVLWASPMHVSGAVLGLASSRSLVFSWASSDTRIIQNICLSAVLVLSLGLLWNMHQSLLTLGWLGDFIEAIPCILICLSAVITHLSGKAVPRLALWGFGLGGLQVFRAGLLTSEHHPSALSSMLSVFRSVYPMLPIEQGWGAVGRSTGGWEGGLRESLPLACPVLFLVSLSIGLRYGWSRRSNFMSSGQSLSEYILPTPGRILRGFGGLMVLGPLSLLFSWVNIPPLLGLGLFFTTQRRGGRYMRPIALYLLHITPLSLFLINAFPRHMGLGRGWTSPGASFPTIYLFLPRV